MDLMPLYYRKTVDRAVKKLINKQYPEEEYVLVDDDVIVLTKVDIRINNPEGDTDESDGNSDDELRTFYDPENQEAADIESDLEDFLDDRPEDELSEKSENEEDDVEEREFDSSASEGDDEIDAESVSNDETETENENGIKLADSGRDSDHDNGDNGNEDDNDDDEPIQSPRKKRKLNVFADDEEASNSTNSDIDATIRVSSSSDDESTASSSGISISTYNARQRDENKFGVYLLPKIDSKRTRLQYHGRIGMPGIKGYCRPNVTKKQFCDLISRKRVKYGHTRLNLMFVNARHLEYRKPDSDQVPNAVRKLLIHLIDQWFPVGIPHDIHLNRAINLLEILQRKIECGKMPRLKHSNKFYELIPHQGESARRPRFKTVDLCANKIEYVKRMKSAIDCLEKFQRPGNDNPWECFLVNWLQIDLRVVEPSEQAHEILSSVIANTQHPNASRQFDVANIFQVENLPHKRTNEFETNITENHRYLFHFTFASNLLCILREGLLVAPQHIHSVNRFLGDGIYFWDAVANAGLNYKSLNIVYVLVCRVALGKQQEVQQQYLQHGEQLQWDADSDSIFCLGKQYKSSRDADCDLNGAKIFAGQLEEKANFTVDQYSLYNEYVVRNENQVKIEYIVKLKLHKDE